MYSNSISIYMSIKIGDIVICDYHATCSDYFQVIGESNKFYTLQFLKMTVVDLPCENIVEYVVN